MLDHWEIHQRLDRSQLLRRQRILGGDREYLDVTAPLVHRAVITRQQRQFLLARTAPGGPKIQYYDSTLEVRKPRFMAVERDDLEVGRRLTDARPGSASTESVRRDGNGQAEPDERVHGELGH